MKFVVSIMLLSLLLIGVLVAVAYICNRLNIGTQTSPTVQINPNDLYSLHQNNYEYFGQYLWRCLQRIQDKCALEPPNHVSGIYAEDTNVRVSYEQGRLIYRYEVPRKLTGLFEGGGKRIRNEAVPTDKIASAIDLSLQHDVSGRFTYTSPVNAFDVSRSRVRIEIIGPYRTFPAQGGFQI